MLNSFVRQYLKRNALTIQARIRVMNIDVANADGSLGVVMRGTSHADHTHAASMSLVPKKQLKQRLRERAAAEPHTALKEIFEEESLK